MYDASGLFHFCNNSRERTSQYNSMLLHVCRVWYVVTCRSVLFSCDLCAIIAAVTRFDSFDPTTIFVTSIN